MRHFQLKQSLFWVFMCLGNCDSDLRCKNKSICYAVLQSFLVDETIRITTLLLMIFTFSFLRYGLWDLSLFSIHNLLCPLIHHIHCLYLCLFLFLFRSFLSCLFFLNIWMLFCNWTNASISLRPQKFKQKNRVHFDGVAKVKTAETSNDKSYDVSSSNCFLFFGLRITFFWI